MSGTGRIRSLDGIRGVASLVVMFYHVSLICRPYIAPESWAWLTQSPLKIFLVGTESVLVFFVLSGLVVALPALRDGFSWLGYYPHRVLRLYLPVIGSLVLATVLIAVFPRNPLMMPEGSWMRDAQATTVTPASFLGEASLFRVTYDINNVLWSLRWEVIFSLALPLFVGLAVLLRRQWLTLATTCSALTVLGRVFEIDALVYLPVFMFGTLIAVNLDRVVAWGAQMRRRPVWLVLAVLGCLLMVVSWLARPVFESGTLGNSILWGLAGIGAALVIVLAIAWPAVRAQLERPSVQWLGKVSFSLYLVHAPILGTLGYLFGEQYWWAVGLVGVPLSVLAAAAFFRWVEAPTQRLSRHAGRWVVERALTRRPVAP